MSNKLTRLSELQAPTLYQPMHPSEHEIKHCIRHGEK